MTDKRFRMIDKRFQIFSSVIEDTQGIIPIILCNNDKQKQKFYDGLNGLNDENEQLKEKLKKYEEIEELKKENFMNCHNCKYDRSVHDGVVLDGMCAIDELMNNDGYFDTEYHRLPNGTVCPCWELEE